MMDLHGVYRENKDTKEITYLSPKYEWIEDKDAGLKTNEEAAAGLKRSFHAAEVQKKDKWMFSFDTFLHDEHN